MLAFRSKRSPLRIVIGFAVFIATICSILPASTTLASSTSTSQAQASTGFTADKDVPLTARRKAAQLIEDVRYSDMASGWEKAQLGALARAVYRLDFEGVAYYEFPVVVGEAPAGYITVSTGDHDFPIAEWNYSGESPTQELERQAAEKGEFDLTFYKLDAVAYAAENSKGELVASSGMNQPKVTGMDYAALDRPAELTESVWTPDSSVSDSSITAQSSGKLVTTGPTSSTIQFSAWESWGQLKEGYRESYGVLAESLRREASADWNVDRLAEEYGEGLTVGTTYPLALLSADVLDVSTGGEGADYVSTEIVKREALPPILNILVNRSDPEATLSFDVKIAYADGQTELVKFFILPGTPSTSAATKSQSSAATQQAASQFSTTGAWSPYTSYWTGDANDVNDGFDQRLYTQMLSGQAPNTSGCASGCGATAWAMLFGWADNQAAIGNSYWAQRWGIYRQNGGRGANVVAPRVMDSGVRNMTWEIRNQIGTFCALGQGPTPPWSMDEAAKYLAGRSATTLSTHYNVVGDYEGRLRDYAIKSIKNRHTPAIIGIGFLSHYPLAYGYKVRSRAVHTCLPPSGQPPFTSWCYDWIEYDRQFRVNMGGGSSVGKWVPANTWFAGEIAP